MDEINLVSVIASDHFGDMIGAVVRTLLLHPGIRLQEIPQYATEALSYKAVRDAVSTLFHHGILLTEQLQGGVETVYRVDTASVLLRCRFPEFVRVAESEYDELGAGITKIFFQRGQLTPRDVIALLSSRGGLREFTPEQVEEVLTHMVQDGFLWMVGYVGPTAKEGKYFGPPEHRATESFPQKRSHDKAFEAEESGEDHIAVRNDAGATDNRASNEFLRMLENSSRENIDWVYVGIDDLGTRRKKVPCPKARDNRTVWRVSFWYLNRLMRLSVCANVVKAHLKDPYAVKLLSGAMRYALSIEDQARPTDDVRSSLLSLRKVKRYMDDVLEGPSDMQTLKRSVKLMARSDYKFLSIENVDERDSVIDFRVEIAYLVCLVRQQTADDIVQMRTGKYGRRIFRALARVGRLEEKTVADKAMMPLKTACVELYKLLDEDFVHRQEIPKSSDVRALNCYYLWGVDMESVYKHILVRLYHSTYNLFSRLTVLKRLELASKEGSPKSVHRKQLDLLEQSILRNSRAIMLFRDLGPHHETVQLKPLRLNER